MKGKILLTAIEFGPKIFLGLTGLFLLLPAVSSAASLNGAYSLLNSNAQPVDIVTGSDGYLRIKKNYEK
jgi:hypothetical protein